MKLKSLSISRQWYGPNKDHLVGEITFENPSGEVKVLLNEEQCQRILPVVADALVAETKKVAQFLAADIIEGTPQLTDSTVGDGSAQT